MQSRVTPIIAAGLMLTFSFAAAADSFVIDFESYAHGRILTTQQPGVVISADNRGGGPDLAVVFDSTLRQTRDPDLEGPNGVNGAWSGGNLPAGTILGNLLIIQENSRGIDDGIADYPDDEGSRPAGSLHFDFLKPITSFGFDLVDVEGVSEYDAGRSGFVRFISGGIDQVVNFADLVNNSSAFYIPGLAFGNHSANRIAPITADALGMDSFERVEINLGGSGGVDNIVAHSVPSPTALAGGVLLGVLVLARRARPRPARDFKAM